MGLFLTLLKRKRGIILFVVAFMLPLFFVVAVSIGTITKRKDTTYNLLESNLWLSGRSALNQFEQQFIEIEDKWLSIAGFNDLLTGKNFDQTNTDPDLFLIDYEFNIVYPEALKDDSFAFLVYDTDWDPNYRKFMSRAEMAEQKLQNYSRAIKDYQKALTVAETEQQKGLALERIARSYFYDKNYRLAVRYYQILKKEYSQIKNLSGHPYGITAPLQLYTIGNRLEEKVISQDSLQLIYKLLNDGRWMINSSTYFFFKAEYESILGTEAGSSKSRFEQLLKFNQFLYDFVVPYIKESSMFPELDKTDNPKRTYIPTDKRPYLVSYRKIQVQNTDASYFVGIRWDLDSVITQMIPSILDGLEEETGLDFLIVNNDNMNLFTREPAQVPEESLTLSFNNIPFPWSLVAIQPGYEKLESDVKIQLIIYGLLVAIILTLMFFGVIVLLRDINRETESMLLKTEFVHNVSHELKTPLSLIRLYGETLLLKDNLPDEDRKDGLMIITKESERLSHMINNILDFSKIEMGRKEFDLKPGNLVEVVRNTMNSYRYHFVKKGFKIEEKIEEEIPEVMFDIDAVEGILINLFSNVIKFSIKEKEILLKLEKTPEGISLSVADKGIGIPPQELPNIFNRFYRAKNSSDFDASGSGLGLTLVKHVIDAHGWQIKVESTPEEGSTFVITIPFISNNKEVL